MKRLLLFALFCVIVSPLLGVTVINWSNKEVVKITAIDIDGNNLEHTNDEILCLLQPDMEISFNENGFSCVYAETPHNFKNLTSDTVIIFKTNDWSRIEKGDFKSSFIEEAFRSWDKTTPGVTIKNESKNVVKITAIDIGDKHIELQNSEPLCLLKSGMAIFFRINGFTCGDTLFHNFGIGARITFYEGGVRVG